MCTRQSKVALLVFLSLFLVIVSMLACAKPTYAQSAPKSKPIEMRMAHFQPEQRVNMVGIKWWSDQVEKRTGGRILIKHYFAEKLAGAMDILPLVRQGGVEMGTVGLSYHISEFPLSCLVGDYQWSTIDEYFWVWPRLVEKVPALSDEFRKNNIKLLSQGGSPPYGMALMKDVKNLDGLKNLKVRVWGKPYPRE